MKPLVAGVSVLVLTVPVLSLIPDSGLAWPAMATVAAEDRADAVRFRTTFGLAADANTIDAAFSSPEYSRETYGVPLSGDELAEMARRSDVQARIDAIAEQASRLPAFAGMFMDQRDHGTPVFLFGSRLAERTADLAEIPPSASKPRITQATS